MKSYQLFASAISPFGHSLTCYLQAQISPSEGFLLHSLFAHLQFDGDYTS